jgi:tetratricopeptide (TPR) repeat protein
VCAQSPSITESLWLAACNTRKVDALGLAVEGAIVEVAINRDKVLEAAQKYVEKKKYDKAVAELRKLVDADPNDARTLLKIGDLQAKQVLYADAINTYESVGKLYSSQGFALKAIAVYKQIREIIAKHVPQLEERYGHIAPKLAELYQQLGLTSDALAALDEVATRLQRQQKDQEAIEVFRRIVELDPTNPLPHLRLAEALSRVKDVEGAVYEFKTAASQLAGIGRRDDALKVLERLLHHRPDPEQAKICAELYLSRSQPQDGMQALAKLQICFQANPRDFDTLSLLARAFNAIGQGAKAIEVQKEMARVARDTGKTDLFREILERLMRVAPHDEGVRRLASQTGPVHAAPPPYGAAAMAPPPAPHEEPPRHAPPQQGYPQQPPAVWGQQAQTGARPAAPPPAPAPSAPQAYGLARPNAESLQRPRTEPVQPLPMPMPLEEVDELSYDEDLEEVVEEEAQVEDAQSYAEVSYGEESEAYEADGYAEEGAEQATAYGDPQEGYGEFQESGYAGNEPYRAGRPEYVTAAGDDGTALEQQDQPSTLSDAEVVEQISKTLADANAFRRVRLYAKAIETLREGLEIDPGSMDLHEVYRDVLIESGQTEAAVHEMLTIAGLYVDALDGDSAARALQDVLAFDPANARAIEMLQELGYEIVDENEESAAGAAGEELDAARGAYAEDGDDAQLPSYDLEEIGPADVSTQYADDREIHVGRGASHAPSFGEAELGGESLPSFPLDEPESQDVYSHHVEHVEPDADGDADNRSGSLRPADDGEVAPPAAFGRVASVAPGRPSGAPSIAAAASQELEDALDEAEFFCSRGLFDDARAILTEQLSKHPNNPLLRERLAELDAQEVQRGSGAREKPREEEGRSFDLGSSLDALESLDYANMEPAEGHAGEDEQVDVEEVFAKFKEGVAKQISVEDSDSHYNLGIAYKEMLLLDDAIREFDVAARDPKHECVCRSMIGMIQIERGNINEAIEAFLQGLNASIKDPSQETVLCFEIGAAYEAKKMNKDALSYYQKAMRRDPNYRDVQERVRRLSKAEPKQSMRQAAVGADDEFDRAFDDLVSKA